MKLYILVLFITTLTSFQQLAAQDTLKVDWMATQKELKTTPTLQVVVNAKLRRGSEIHDQAFAALKELQCDYVRFCPWFPYPRLGVAELEEPKDGNTSWDFKLMDELVEDFMNATQGHQVVMAFSTTPQWMWKSDWYTGAPADPNQEEWGYNVGSELKDPSGKQLAAYFKRVFQWYSKGGFIDENGKHFKSNHNYKIQNWEVLNEPEVEHYINPKLYNTIYDATVSELKKVDPSVKFVGASLMRIKEITPEFMETFLDPKQHKAGIPLDYVSYHAYVWINQKRGINSEQYSSFEQARQFVEQFYFIDAIRKRLSPKTKTMINEVGTIRYDDAHNSNSEIEPWYWSLSAAIYAYLYSELADMGADVVGESQLVGYQYQFPCVSMIDWKTGEPNLRYWVLKLLKDNFNDGGKILGWAKGADNQLDFYARPFITKDGKKKLLLINQRDRILKMTIPGSARIQWVDESGVGIQKASVAANHVQLNRFAVAIIEVE